MSDDLPIADHSLLDGQVVLLGPDRRNSFQPLLSDAIPELADRMVLIGYDWIGRPIGISTAEDEELLIYDSIFDELMEFAMPDGRILTSPLFSASKDNFGVGEYESFLTRLGVRRLELGKCAGFTVPPQLGGEVSAVNLELDDLPVYWHLSSMLHDAISSLPNGAVLKSIIAQ